MAEILIYISNERWLRQLMDGPAAPVQPYSVVNYM